MIRWLLLIVLLTLTGPAWAQNTTCATRPVGDDSNACASTAFVHNGYLPLTGFTPNLPLIGSGSGGITQGTISGNTTVYGTVSGTLTSGHCVSINSGNLVDNGSSCGSSTGSVGSGTAQQLAYYPTTGTNVSGTFTPNFPATGFWYVDNGANITRLNDQVLLGGATVWAGHSGSTGTQDWFSTYQESLGITGGSVQFASLSALTQPSTAGASNENGILGAAQSFYSTSAGASTIGIFGAALNDNEQWIGTGHISGTTFTIDTTTSGTVAIGQYLQINGATAIQITSGSGITWTLASSGGTVSTTTMFTSLQTDAWGYYGECHKVAASVGQCNGIEVDVRNQANEVAADPYTVQVAPTNLQITNGVSSGCGAGVSISGTSPCSNAFLVFANPQQWDAGLLFAAGSIHTGAGGGVNAIAMPVNYQINWFSSAGVISGTIAEDNSGFFDINTTTGLKISGLAGATCSSGINATTFRSTFGIVTHC